MARGTIKFFTPLPQGAFGFIRQADGPDLFFARTSLAEGVRDDDVEADREVEFDVVTGAKVQQAANVRPVLKG